MTTAADPRAAALAAAFGRESATTLKVLHAYPAAQADFKPHERSSSAKQLAWTFVVEARLATYAIHEGNPIGKAFIAPPESWDEIVRAVASNYAELQQLVASLTPEQLDGKATFFTGPKQLGEYPMTDFLWFLLHDQIHHRGQLSVYLRMTGAKVPSIYGPSADEPWN